MKKTQLTNEMQSLIQSNNGLQRYLRSLTEGKDFTPRSWLYEDQSADIVLNRWLETLNSLQDGLTHEEAVFQFDISQLKKWGPQGGVKPVAELEEIYSEGFKDFSVPTAFSTPEWEDAVFSITHFLTGDCHVHDLRPASYKSVVDDMRARDVLESNSGYPLFTRRNKPEVKASSIADAESGEWRKYPAIALFRNYNQKTRLVWMFPMSTNLVEGSYYQPLYAALTKTKLGFFSPWEGFDRVRAFVTDVYGQGNYIAASDFSSTDAHFRKATTEQVARVLEACFKPEYRQGLHESLMHMHEIPLIIGPNTMITGEHGVSSGSNWTNFVETIFDLIFAEYVRIKQEKAKNGSQVIQSNPLIPASDVYYGMYAIGDDMSWQSTRYSEDFAEMLEEYGEMVGQVIKAEKTTNDKDKVKSLQRLFQRGYSREDGQLRGVYSTIRALNSSLHPERFHNPKKWSSDMFCIRQFMILENCVDHPLFEEFVKFVCAGNRHLIPFAKKSASEQERALRESKLLPGLNTTYNQEKRDAKISSFKSIQIAAKLE